MVGSRPSGERGGNPVQVRDGPAAVRGDAPAPNCHWPSGWEGGAGGSPESEHLPLASKTEPLAEGGFVPRRLCIFVVALVAALLVVPAALALRVHVRVEGPTRTIYGSTEPALSLQSNAPAALASASVAGQFYYHVAIASFGRYVDRIGRYSAGGSSGWVFKVNGVSPPLGPAPGPMGRRRAPVWY